MKNIQMLIWRWLRMRMLHVQRPTLHLRTAVFLHSRSFGRSSFAATGKGSAKTRVHGKNMKGPREWRAPMRILGMVYFDVFQLETGSSASALQRDCRTENLEGRISSKRTG